MKKFMGLSLPFFYILFAGIIAACTTTFSDINLTSITITPLDSETIKVEYVLGKNCQSINLLTPYQERTQLLRKEWRVLDNCGELSPSGVLTQNKSCRSISLAIPIRASNIDRVNPTSYPLGKDGVLVHTGIFAVDNSCGKIIWTFFSPHGSVVVDGKNRGRSLKINQTNEPFIKHTGVYFSYSIMNNTRPIVITKDVPLWLKQGILDVDFNLAPYYSSTYPYLNFTSPALFLDNIKTGSRPSSQADVSSPHMVRFAFFNYIDADFVQNISNIKGMSAHEYAHILQPKNLTESRDPFVSEGGTEFIRWITEYRLGWRNKEFLASDFSNNLANCLSILDNRPWRDVPLSVKHRGSFPYACGLSIHIIALASRKNLENSEQTIGNYYLQIKKNPSVDFAQSLECGNSKKCKASWLPSLLSGEESARKQINDQLYKLGVVKELSYGHDKNNLLLLSEIIFKGLVIEDCGDVGFWTNQDHL